MEVCIDIQDEPHCSLHSLSSLFGSERLSGRPTLKDASSSRTVPVYSEVNGRASTPLPLCHNSEEDLKRIVVKKEDNFDWGIVERGTDDLFTRALSEYVADSKFETALRSIIKLCGSSDWINTGIPGRLDVMDRRTFYWHVGSILLRVGSNVSRSSSNEQETARMARNTEMTPSPADSVFMYSPPSCISEDAMEEEPMGPPPTKQLKPEEAAAEYIPETSVLKGVASRVDEPRNLQKMGLMLFKKMFSTEEIYTCYFGERGGREVFDPEKLDTLKRVLAVLLEQPLNVSQSMMKQRLATTDRPSLSQSQWGKLFPCLVSYVSRQKNLKRKHDNEIDVDN